MIVKFMKDYKRIATRYDLQFIPSKGEHVILHDDNDYVVESIAWDLMNSKSAAVIELKEMDNKTKKKLGIKNESK